MAVDSLKIFSKDKHLATLTFANQKYTFTYTSELEKQKIDPFGGATEVFTYETALEEDLPELPSPFKELVKEDSNDPLLDLKKAKQIGDYTVKWKRNLKIHILLYF